MSLINCPECNKEISDRSVVCIHCGYPIKKNTKCVINGVEYDLSFILEEANKAEILEEVNKAKIIGIFMKIANCGLKDAISTVNKIIEDNEIPKFLFLKPEEPDEQIIQNKPHCPTCSSTNIRKISGISKAGSIAMWGIFSRKVHKQWHCNNCGSEW
ncbi:MAG: zinc-ribbon domain-containing protein [Lachnospiraceae bacterium]|nr:zinc-ribbon domain-containing protein [Lachnospiraceae bacterium]